MNTLTYIALAVGVLALCALQYLAWRSGFAHGRRQESKIDAAARAESRQRIAELQAEVERARQVADAERDKSSRYFLKITDFEKERDQWQELYTRQSIGHGNAQSLMMRTMEQMAQQLQAKGVRAQIPKALHAVREEFLQNHELPAREVAAKMAENRALSQQNQPLATEVARQG